MTTIDVILDEINDKTGFAMGDKFTSEEDVHGYFSAEHMSELGITFSQNELDEMAKTVINNRIWCEFTK